MAEVFLDTAYAGALAAPTDAHHAQALQWADRLEAQATQLVTTPATLIEIGNGLAKARYRRAAIRVLSALIADPTVTIVPLSEGLYLRAFQLYRSRLDKEWGLTDCISFIVMQDRGISAALTSDVHFQQAGFQALLREPAS